MSNNITNDKIDILSLNLEKLQEIFVITGLKKFNAAQVFDWLHNKLIFDFDRFTNISKNDREILKKRFYLPKLEYRTHQISDDKNTEKFLFELKDKRLIESVLISHKNRHTLCVSSQIGCLLGCDFCATATMNYERNLDISEILLQFYYVQNYLSKRGEKLGNVVFMGMGEPFLNYDSVIGAINILNCDKGQNFSKRNFTISTSGIIPGIKSGIISALIFTFIPIFGAYTVPLLVGGKESYMLGNLIVDQVQKTRNWPLAAAFSMVITIISIAGILMITRTAKKEAQLKKKSTKEDNYVGGAR